jgi:HD-GYP domain-containing protein (c-di-GMP phosphodiesterase class II)
MPFPSAPFSQRRSTRQQCVWGSERCLQRMDDPTQQAVASGCPNHSCPAGLIESTPFSRDSSSRPRSRNLLVMEVRLGTPDCFACVARAPFRWAAARIVSRDKEGCMVARIDEMRIGRHMTSPLKKILIAQVTLGMYVHKICGRWVDHPFWKRSFLVSSAKTLGTLHTLGNREVWIDTFKGVDVATAASTVPATRTSEVAVVPAAEPELAPPRTAFGDEVAQAEAVRDRAKGVVKSLFHDARMGRALGMDAATEIVSEVSGAIARSPAAMLSVLRLKKKDDYTYLHSVAVSALMMALGRRLGVEGAALEDLGMAGLLHDIGKVGVADAVLNKPGRLNPLEMCSIRLHPQIAWDILRKESGPSAVALDVCLHHHEKIDGSGYPDKLSGDAISREARLGAICDVYDAITSDRPYKKGWEPAEAIRRMAEWQEGHFDRDLFHAFVKLIGIYPTGTLVRLKSQRLAVVLTQGRNSSLTPIVRAFRSLPSNEDIEPVLVDLDDPVDAIIGIENPSEWGINMPVLLRA